MFAFLRNVDWIGWFEKTLCASGLFLVLTIFIWVIPLIVDWFIGFTRVHAKLRQGGIIIMRLIMAIASAFIIADVLELDSGLVQAAFVTVFGVGISWAVCYYFGVCIHF